MRGRQAVSAGVAVSGGVCQLQWQQQQRGRADREGGTLAAAAARARDTFAA